MHMQLKYLNPLLVINQTYYPVHMQLKILKIIVSTNQTYNSVIKVSGFMLLSGKFFCVKSGEN